MIIGHIDISPLVILLALYFLDNLLYPMLMDIAIQMAMSSGGFRT
jgi:uncharacterized protein YggT (Ycf19 family)